MAAEEEGMFNNGGGAEEEERLLTEGVAVLDFDMLCSAVAAMQSQGKCKWTKLDDYNNNNNEEEEEREYDEFGGQNGPGVLRMWEGDVVNCFDDQTIALESAWYYIFFNYYVSF